MGNLHRKDIQAKDRLQKRIGRYPALLIGQLAICNGNQSGDIGTHICDFCLNRAVRLSKVIVCRFLVVDAISSAVGFYGKYGFALAPNQGKRDQKLMFLDITKRKP